MGKVKYLSKCGTWRLALALVISSEASEPS
jgi:hypothetical protein